jgi:hypothetical protein
MTALRLALLLVATGLVTAGGGGPDDAPEATPPSDGGDRAATTSSTSPLSADPPPRRRAPAGPPATPTDQRRSRTVTGTVTVVAGCTVLDEGGVRWALEGDLAGIGPGSVVTVTGRPTGQVDPVCGDAILRVAAIDAG